MYSSQDAAPRRSKASTWQPRIMQVLLVAFTVVTLSGAALAQKGTSKARKHDVAKSTSTSEKTPWLIKWNGGEVLLPEFESAFKRMNDRDPYATTLDSLKDFLSIYADYRLKLQEAREQGLDKDPKIMKEIDGYRAMLAGPFLLDKEVTDPAVHKLFERRQSEVHAAHFLAYVKNWNDPADTLKAYRKAQRAIEMLDAGYPISYVAMSPANRALLSDVDNKYLSSKANRDTSKMENWEGSDDKATAKVGGELGWFTAGMTVRPFEDAVYSLKPGDYTKYPVRTRFGYHVIYLYDKTPHTGGVHVKHILVQMPKVGGVDTVSFYHRADSLLTLLHNGANFEDLARDASDDKYTASRGGDFDTINREDRRAEASFDHAAYSLKDGEISGIVRTTFGYHIIKRVNGVAPKTYDQVKDQLKQFYKRFYYEDDKDHYLTALYKKLNLHVDSSAIDYFLTHVDSNRTSADSAWYVRLDRNKAMFHLGDVNWTVGALVDSLQAMRGTPLARNTVKDQLTKNVENAAIAVETRGIASRYPDFEKIMEDYKNGIILFDMENSRVWSKVVPDSASERKYFDSHRAKFLWPERVDLSEIFVTSDSLAKSIYKRIMAGENFDTLASKYTERPGFKGKAGHWGILTKDENELARRSFNFMTDEVKEPFAFQGGFSIVRLNRRDPIHQKTFEEARQEVASQYQDDRAGELRQQWVEELRTKYGRQINEPLITAEWKKHQGGNDQSQLVK